MKKTFAVIFAVIIIAAFLIFPFAAGASASDGPDADDTITGDRAGCFTIEFTDEFFEFHSDFFTEDKFPLTVRAVETTDADNMITFSIEQASTCDALIEPSSGEEFWLIIEDYKDDNGQTIYIANAESDPSLSYAPDSSGTSVYTASHLTSALERDTVLDTDLGQIKVSFYSPAGVFELGSKFFADTLSGDEADAVKAVIDEEYLEGLEGICCSTLS